MGAGSRMQPSRTKKAMCLAWQYGCAEKRSWSQSEPGPSKSQKPDRDLGTSGQNGWTLFLEPRGDLMKGELFRSALPSPERALASTFFLLTLREDILIYFRGRKPLLLHQPQASASDPHNSPSSSRAKGQHPSPDPKRISQGSELAFSFINIGI